MKAMVYRTRVNTDIGSWLFILRHNALESLLPFYVKK